jgi:tRNA1Val (adenine37-N6)-methyltransferase
MKGNIEPREDETVDSLSCAKLRILQKKYGYRYSLDAYLLAAFVEESPGTHILEIGSGSGVISILLAAVKGLKVTGVEIQENLAEMSRRSVEYCGLSDSVQIVCSDIREILGPRVEVVVTNPPFRPLATGRINPSREKALARHELALDLEGLLRKAYELLIPGGRFYIVYPAWRIPDLICSMRVHRLEPKCVRSVHPSLGTNAQICLVCGLREGGRECSIERPLYVYAEDGSYHEEIKAMFQCLSFQKKPLTSRRDT